MHRNPTNQTHFQVQPGLAILIHRSEAPAADGIERALLHSGTTTAWWFLLRVCIIIFQSINAGIKYELSHTDRRPTTRPEAGGKLSSPGSCPSRWCMRPCWNSPFETRKSPASTPGATSAVSGLGPCWTLHFPFPFFFSFFCRGELGWERRWKTVIYTEFHWLLLLLLLGFILLILPFSPDSLSDLYFCGVVHWVRDIPSPCSFGTCGAGCGGRQYPSAEFWTQIAFPSWESPKHLFPISERRSPPGKNSPTEICFTFSHSDSCDPILRFTFFSSVFQTNSSMPYTLQIFTYFLIFFLC